MAPVNSGSVLFIRADDNGFENFISAQIRSRGYEVVEPYSVPVGEIYSLPFFPRVLFRHGPVFMYSSLLGQWKEKISSYGTVIIFDKALTVQLVRAIRKYAPRCRIVVWMWNCREVEDLDEIRRMAEVCWFDPGYARKFGCRYVPQFHFKDAFCCGGVSSPGVYYIGYDKSRLDELVRLSGLFDRVGVASRLILQRSPDRTYEGSYPVELTDVSTDYDSVLSSEMEYSCLLELVIPEQTGLSLRALEALFMGKKFITNNADIVSYDLYSPDNVFILGIDDESMLSGFVSGEYCPVSPEIVSGYTFERWLERMLDR